MLEGKLQNINSQRQSLREFIFASALYAYLTSDNSRIRKNYFDSDNIQTENTRLLLQYFL